MNLIHRGQNPPLNTNAIWVVNGEIRIFQNEGWKKVSISGDLEDFLSETSRKFIKNKAIYNQYITEEELFNISFIYKNSPLTFEALEDGDIKWACNSSESAKSIEYKKNSGTWTTITATSTGVSIPLSKGDIIKFRGDNTTYIYKDPQNPFLSGKSSFTTSTKINIYGNIMSMISSSNFSSLLELPSNEIFSGFFGGVKVINAKYLLLPATSLTAGCYEKMFYANNDLKTAPVLPATTLADSCYLQMFYYCTSLETAPILPASTLIANCYSGMFMGCHNLKEIECLAEDISANNCTRRWVEGVAPKGTFVSKSEDWTTGVNGIPEGWEVDNPKQTYLTLNILTDGNLQWKVAYGENPDDSYYYQYETDACKRTIQYSKNRGEWVNITSSLHSEPATAFSVKAGDEIRLRGYNSTYLTDVSQWRFSSSFIDSTCTFDMKGNIMSLIDGDNFSSLNNFSATYAFYYVFRRTGIRNAKNLYLIKATHTGCYWGLFKGSTLVTAPNLPAEILSKGCYRSMFEECSNLLEAPELPVTTLAEQCYCSMFEGCSSLTSAPELPALTMQKLCYSHMFSGCTSISSVPELPATTLAESCYSGMFEDCTSLTTVPSNLLPVTSLAKYCYQTMFSGCTSLTNTPELPAMSLQQDCYYAMFMMCTSLTATPDLPATTLAADCYANMFNGCRNIVTVMSELPATSAPDYAYIQMFKGCTSITESPDIKATTHGQYTFNVMFQGCSSLSKITCRVTQSNSAYFYNWVKDVAATGTFYKRSGTTWTNGLNGIPTGWTTQNI